MSEVEEKPEFLRVKHMCNLGDIVASLASVKKYSELFGKKVIYCQMINALAAYYPGAVHPTVDDNGSQVCVNNKMYEMIRPLILAQDYIHDVEIYNGQKIQLDLDIIRGNVFVNMPNGMIQSWIMYAYPNLACDLSKPWMTIPEVESHPIEEQVKGKIILNFTERYRNQVSDYFFLKKHMDKLVFAGTEKEHFIFCNRWELDIPRLEVNDFLEAAYALKYCKFFLGCQSFLWNLAQAMHIPRIVELCNYAPNIQPFIGEKSFGFYHQAGLEYYFDLLNQ